MKSCPEKRSAFQGKATFDLDALRSHRSRNTWGNAFRRPHRYHLLTSLDIEPPFVRVNAQGERYDPSRR